MGRILSVVTAVVLASVTFWDVYVLASDVSQAAPWWRLGLGLTDVSLLGTIAGLVWRRANGAHQVVLGDLFFVLGAALVIVSVDGVSSLVWGFGTAAFLSVFIATLALRVGLYLSLAPREVKPVRAAV